MAVTLVCLLAAAAVVACAAAEHCAAGTASCGESGDDFGPALRRRIEHVLDSFTLCTGDCFSKTLQADLAPYLHGGIKRDAFVEACAQHNVIRYQIFNHRLYRQEKCMFSARCEGIEHFILDLLPVCSNYDTWCCVPCLRRLTNR
jgi:protein glucosyltransferase